MTDDLISQKLLKNVLLYFRARHGFIGCPLTPFKARRDQVFQAIGFQSLERSAFVPTVDCA